MKPRMILMLLLAVIMFTGSCSKKTPTLNLLVWEGYADPSFVKAFEEQHHCKISASYMGSSDELTTKLNGGAAARIAGALPALRCKLHKKNACTTLAGRTIMLPVD